MFVPLHGKPNLAYYAIASLSYLLKQKSIFASSTFLLLMFQKNGVSNRDSAEHRAAEASKVIMGKMSER